MARPICFRLFVHCACRAASRADCTAGSKSEIRTAMIAITTSNSISVKPRRVVGIRLCSFIEGPNKIEMRKLVNNKSMWI